MFVQLIAKIVNLIIWIMVIFIAIVAWKANEAGVFDSFNMVPKDVKPIENKVNTKGGLIIPKYDNRVYDVLD